MADKDKDVEVSEAAFFLFLFVASPFFAQTSHGPFLTCTILSSFVVFLLWSYPVLQHDWWQETKKEVL